MEGLVRPVDDLLAFDTGYPRHRAQVLSQAESALVFASTVGEGGCAAGLHYHHFDQMYFLFEGQMSARLGDDVRELTVGTFVHIPAGLAHCNWNDGPGQETHLEICAPSPAIPGSKLAFAVDGPEDVPADVRATRKATVRAVDPDDLVQLASGARYQSLAESTDGIESAAVYYVETEPGLGRRLMHLHEFDQYYFVLGGRLTVDFAIGSLEVPARHLLFLPAGVPHRLSNAGSTTETHLAMDIPPPVGTDWDHVVEISPARDQLS